jgi:Xaa-Pro aminopeptidase
MERIVRQARHVPFDADRLDALLDGAGVDVVVATSQHNVRYLLGSYSSFFASFDAIGVDRYLPAVAIARGRLGDAFAVGHPIDEGLHEVARPWVPTLLDASHSAADTARLVAERLPARAVVAIEQSFAPHRFVRGLGDALPGATLVEAAPLLEDLRAVKRADELALMREAADLRVQALAAAAVAAPGRTKHEIVELVHTE